MKDFLIVEIFCGFWEVREVIFVVLFDRLFRLLLNKISFLLLEIFVKKLLELDRRVLFIEEKNLKHALSKFIFGLVFSHDKN